MHLDVVGRKTTHPARNAVLREHEDGLVVPQR
jgi:hypothetical protein